MRRISNNLIEYNTNINNKAHENLDWGMFVYTKNGMKLVNKNEQIKLTDKDHEENEKYKKLSITK